VIDISTLCLKKRHWCCTL